MAKKKVEKKKTIKREKKKVEEVKEFIPSKYQKAIFDFIAHGTGNLVVEACAGSGKTFSIVKSLAFIPKDKRVLMTAFNRDIVTELEKKTQEFDNVETSTLHSLGLRMLRSNFPQKAFAIQAFKYDTFIKENISKLSKIDLHELGKDFYRYVNNIKKYVDFGRYYICDSIKDLDMIEERYGIDTIADEKEIALIAMDWGKTVLDEVDFADMVWLPHVLFCKPYGLQYDFIFIDECQDVNKAERELVLKCFKMGTRLISVGDRSQCAYSFAGGDPESFKVLCSLPNTTKLPLSISYRCADNVVNFAKRLVPSIEKNEDGRIGEVVFDASMEDIGDGDMILCRNNAPLIQAYNMLLKSGRKCFIRGKDIGRNLKTIVESMKQEFLNVDCTKDGLFVRLYDDLFTTRNKIINRTGVDAKTAMTAQLPSDKLDMIKALEVLSEGLNTSKELLSKIDKIFPKRDKKEGISLSTIHKAKGLEANNVYIICKSLMPSKAAKKDWEVMQEHNLMYIAYTRAKNKLAFVDEKEFKDFDSTSLDNIKKLNEIEEQVNKVLGKETTIVMTGGTARNIVITAEKVEPKVKRRKTVSIESDNKNANSFSDILKNKTTKRKKKI